MAQKCSACGKFLRGGVVCSICNSLSHNECVRVPFGAEVPKDWRCGDCQMRTPKGRDPSTPVRVSQMHLNIPAGAKSEERAADQYAERPAETAMAEAGVRLNESVVLDDTANNITAEFGDMELQLNLRPYQEELLNEFSKLQTNLLAEMRGLKSEVLNMCTELREIKLEMSDFRVSLAGVSARMDGLEERLVAVEQQRTATTIEPTSHAAAVVDLQSTVVRLQQELNDRDQDDLLSDLEIGHLPEERGESVLHAVTVLAIKLGVPLEERDVVFAERVGVTQGAGPGGEAPRARRVVVRLARRHLRDQLLQAARVRRTLAAADAGRASSGPGGRIFLNESLTRPNRQLFHRVREECRRIQWQYSWTKRGRIYARQADGKPAYLIRSVADFERVFGASPV